MHKVFCIMGRTASGKSTIVNAVAKAMKLKVLKSYTTRARRKNEVENNCDHTFISADDVSKYVDDMVAYTERAGYCSFATESQLMCSDLYIINPSGYSDLINTTRDIPNLQLVDIWIDCDTDQLQLRSKKRSTADNWQANYIKESEEFANFEKSHLVDYLILNDGNIEESVARMIRVINKDIAKTRYYK